MNYEILAIGFLLFLFSLMDFKFKAIPSVFLTGILIVLLFLHPYSLYIGLIALVYALLLYEFGFISGVADIKVIVIIGLMIKSAYILMIFMALIVIYGCIWKLLVKWMYKIKKIQTKEIAFVPVLFFVFLSLALSGLI